MANLATLINTSLPEGDPNRTKIVETGSDIAQGHFSSGYNLMGPTGAPEIKKPITNNASNAVPPTPEELAGGGSTDSKALSDILDSAKPDYSAYEAPDTTKQTSDIEELKKTFSTADIEKNLERQLAGIGVKYSTLADQLEQEQTSQKQADISGLYDVGIVNPLSSGTQSVASFADVTKGKLQQNLLAQKAIEESAAQETAYGRKTTATQNLLGIAQEEKASIEAEARTKYEDERQKWTDSQTAVQNAFNIYKGGKELAQGDIDAAWQGFNNILSISGSAVFNGMSDDDLNTMAGSLGVKKEQLDSAAKYLQKQEILGQAPELREVDGNLYAMERDKEGNYVPKLLIKKSPPKVSGPKITYEMVKNNPEMYWMIGQSVLNLKIPDYKTWLDQKSTEAGLTLDPTNPEALQAYESEVSKYSGIQDEPGTEFKQNQQIKDMINQDLDLWKSWPLEKRQEFIESNGGNTMDPLGDFGYLLQLGLQEEQPEK